MLDYQKAHEILEYKDGCLYWKNTIYKSFQKAGSVHKHRGHVYVCIDKKKYLAHRVIWLMNTGLWPDSFIDHIDGDRSNNLISNLRLATSSQNNRNVKLRKDNKSGFKGVCFSKDKRKFVSKISIDGKQVFLGHFDTAELAYQAYCNASKKHHKEFSRTK